MLKQLITLGLFTTLTACGGSSSSTDNQTEAKDNNQAEAPSNNNELNITGDTHATIVALSKNNTISGKLSSGSNATFNVLTNDSGRFGKFSIDANGRWTYTAHPANYNLLKTYNFDSFNDVFTVTTSYGQTQTVTITVEVKYQRLARITKIRVPYEGNSVDLYVLLDTQSVEQMVAESYEYTDLEYKTDNNLTLRTDYNFEGDISYQSEYIYKKENGKITGFDRSVKSFINGVGNIFYQRLNSTYQYKFFDDLSYRISNYSRQTKYFNSLGEIHSEIKVETRYKYANFYGKKTAVYTSFDGGNEYQSREYQYINNELELTKQYRYREDGSVYREYSYHHDAYNRQSAYVLENYLTNKTTVQFYAYHPQINAIVAFVIEKDSYETNTATATTLAAHVYQYDDTAECGNVDRVQSAVNVLATSQCRIKNGLPPTVALPTAEELGLTALN
ncbi:VCBS domain-containing protein [Catenovulum sp. SX2]|uniref:VCBS domain-containing protein n=1 Tax=Catenovulum sp. SX2 TaxID=3398614 RepID=UPI003F857A2E